MDTRRKLLVIACILLLTGIAPAGTAAASGAIEDTAFHSAGITLSGNLHFPETRPKAGLVLIHGSARKDSTRMSALARLLADAGFAVLTYDKRGTGKSGGAFQDAADKKTFELLAEDAAAAFRKLQAHPRLQGIPSGFLGISQGGWVGPIAASRVESAAFMLLWSGPVCTVGEELHFSAFAREIPDFFMKTAAARIRKHMESAPRRAGDWDPREVLARLSLPVLWIFGERDNSIPVELSVARLDEMIEGGRRNFEYRVFPEQGHSLDYPTPHPEGYEFMVQWMSDRAAGKQQTSGRSIGQVSTTGDLIVIELHSAALGQPNLFDLVGRTLRFTPVGSSYRVTNERLRWDTNYGSRLTGADVSLRRFTFPFSGQRWNSFSVGTTGSIRFGAAPKEPDVDPYGNVDGGVASAIGRFDRLADIGSSLVARAPAISVFLKPRMSGPHYVRELADRVVITWDLTEPFGGLLDYSWFPTSNLFQAVLHRDGSIEMSYNAMTAKDGIVGLYPKLPAGASAQSSDLSSPTPNSGSFAAVYESFHYLEPPRPQDLSCTVIQALGDKFDFLAYYSDFRIDSQEASSPSDGPIGGNVTGIGDTKHEQTKPILDSRCTDGRFQLGFAQPIFVGANEMQESPPDNAPAVNAKSIAFHTRALAQAAPDGKPRPYNYAVGHLGHEIGHRWSAYAAARVNGETISLGAWPHWDAGLAARVAHPYSLPVEASTQGGGVWQENLDGTVTQLRDGFFVPATGYSYLDLYLMGLIPAAEVPDFFIVRPLERIGADANGRPIFKGQRMRITIRDVIAAEGPRLPDVNQSQRKFNTGIVVIVEHAQKPSADLINRGNGIRRQWIDYWGIATGRRASMTVDPH